MPRSRFRRSPPTQLLLKRRWTADEAQAVLDRLESSGRSVREFADAEGLDPQRLYRWRAQMSRRSAPAFVEIARRAGAQPVEVVLRSGHVVRVPDGFSEETLRRVVAALIGDEPSAC